MNVKYKKVDQYIHGEVKKILLIGEGESHENEMYYYVFWKNHNNQNFGTHVSRSQLSNWFKLDKQNIDKFVVKL